MTTTYILTTKIKTESFMGLFNYYGLIIMTVIMIPRASLTNSARNYTIIFLVNSFVVDVKNINLPKKAPDAPSGSRSAFARSSEYVII